MLARLQNGLGDSNLMDHMLLSSGPASLETAEIQSNDVINLLIGYKGSPNSQVALDLMLWIAHQTRLATQKQVMVHVLYVVDQPLQQKTRRRSTNRHFSKKHANKKETLALSQSVGSLRSAQTTVATPLRRKETLRAPLPHLSHLSDCLTGCQAELDLVPKTPLDQADYILWQARCLAEEWRGSLEAHLRFGSLAESLKTVAKEMKIDLLLLGCSSLDHPQLAELADDFPCPILGIPSQLEEG
ncbi:universal stress protein [Leptolyngbya sp. AN02str]|uniref:universal stress protein n=1 Tax=Leptolyngbya sp. AN02str TaxID=3423363 RepID=UPI003D31F540